jgi:uncharacterized protein (TIGR02646 family)
MIKYDLPPKPSRLTDDLQAELTQEFINHPEKAVWNMTWLKEAVFNKAFGKCCYSDIMLNEESKYMEIDHFYPKSNYAEFVLEWSNLNPSCKTCNASKGAHDPRREPIVNPFQDDPKDYFCFRNYLYCGKNTNGKGKKTIEVLNLNNRKQFVEKRSKVGFDVIARLNHLKDNCDLFLQPHRKYLCMLKNQMREGNRKEEYTALVSTIILSDENFRHIETFLRYRHLWDNELEELKSELAFCALLS